MKHYFTLSCSNEQGANAWKIKILTAALFQACCQQGAIYAEQGKMILNDMAAKNSQMHKMMRLKNRQDAELSAVADGVYGKSFLNPSFFLSRTFAPFALFRGYPWPS